MGHPLRKRFMVPALRRRDNAYEEIDDQPEPVAAVRIFGGILEPDEPDDLEQLFVDLDDPMDDIEDHEPLNWRIGVEVLDGEPLEADVEASLCEDGMHRPIIDMDGLPFTITESSTPGNVHLAVDLPMTWEQYEALLWAMARCGWIQPGYYRASVERGMTRVRLRADKHGAPIRPAVLKNEPGKRLTFTPGVY